MIKRLDLLVFVLCLVLPVFASAAPYYGANFSYSLYGKEPPYIHGFQFMLTYDPNCIKWRRFIVYFDGGFSHFWVTNTPYYRTLNIYSAAPVVRYLFHERARIHPYFEISVGLSYLNHTRLDNRNLGIHFAFQDRIGIGALLGTAENVSVGLHAVHYSNARMSGHNSGITLPIVLDIGYRFK